MTTTLTTSPGQVLDDELIERFAARVARVRPREHVLQRGLRGAAGDRLHDDGRPDRARGPRLHARRRLPREAAPRPACPGHRAGASTCTSTGPGLAADLYRAGDRSLVWLLEEAVAGEVFAAGHGEAGNDLPVLMSVAQAEPVDGGYAFTRPQDLRLPDPGVDPPGPARHGHDRSGQPEDRPRVHAPRHEGLHDRGDVGHARHAADAQRRHDPRGRLRPRPVHRSRRPGRLRRRRSLRARDLRLGRVHVRQHLHRPSPSARSTSRSPRPRSARRSRSAVGHAGVPPDDPARDRRDGLASSKASIPHVERTAADWSNGVDHGGLWPMKLVATKYHAVESAKRVVDLAMDVSGGSGHVQEPGARAAVPRRALRRLPPRELRRSCTRSSARRCSESSARSRVGRRGPPVIVILG